MEFNKILAIDFGTKTIGLAISDIDKKFAIPYEQIPNNNMMFEKINNILKEERIGTIVLGFPKTINNYISERHNLIFQFKEKLEINIENNIKIVLVDESYSTSQTFDSLKGFNVNSKTIKKNKDMIAASIILENYLRKIKR